MVAREDRQIYVYWPFIVTVVFHLLLEINIYLPKVILLPSLGLKPPTSKTHSQQKDLQIKRYCSLNNNINIQDNLKDYIKDKIKVKISIMRLNSKQ